MSVIARLIVTADDCGALPCIDDAVQELLEVGVVTVAAAFPNGTSFSAFAAQIAPKFCIVPHLTLTYGVPLSDVRTLSGLVKTTGEFFQPRDYLKDGFDDAIESWTQTHFRADRSPKAAAEFERQLEYFGALVRETEFLTFHHDIDRAILSRYPNVQLEPLRLGRFGRLRAGSISAAHYRFMTDTVSRADPEQFVLETILAAIECSKGADGLPAEVIFHPSRWSEELRSFSAYDRERVLEFEALKSKRVRELLSAGRRDGHLLEYGH